MQEFTGMDYLRIDIANCFGLDKKEWNDRIQWVHDHETTLEDKCDDVMYLKAVNAYRLTQQGKPTGHMMFFDSSSSFLQIMSLMSGCLEGAKQSNIVDSGTRQDFYTNVTEYMNMLIVSMVTLLRDVVKYIIMPTFYNSKRAAKDQWGEGSEEYNAYYQALWALAPGAMDVMDDINQCWNSNTLGHTWKLPDGHNSVCPVIEKFTTSIEIDELEGKAINYQGKVNCMSDKGISLPANIIQSFDAYIVREMVRRCANKGVKVAPIHDAFGFHPNNGNIVRQTYIDILVDMSKRDLLGDVLSQLTGQDIKYPKRYDLTDSIKNSEYALS